MELREILQCPKEAPNYALGPAPCEYIDMKMGRLSTKQRQQTMQNLDTVIDLTLVCSSCMHPM